MVETELRLNPHIDGTQVRRALESLRGTGEVHLSFATEPDEPGDDEPISSSAQRSALFWTAVLANVLLVEHGSKSLRVTLPWTDNRTMSLLERAGFPFALARRLGPTQVEPTESAAYWLDPCRSPADRSRPTLDGLLSGVERLHRESQPKRRLEPWVVADPHLSYRLDDRDSALPYGWMETVIPQPEAEAAAVAREQLVPLLRGVMKELVENAAAHAFLPGSRPHDRLDLVSGFERSGALVCLTEGGRSSNDRLHLVVLDAGVGIPRTVRTKAPDLGIPSAEILHRALTGEWNDLESAPKSLVTGNNGLNWCRSELLAHARHAGFVVVTECAEGGMVYGEIQRDGTVTTEAIPDIPLRGTIGILTVGLPRGANSVDDEVTHSSTGGRTLERLSV